MTSVKNLYDSYIRAICWGSKRLGESGIMAYVSGNAWIERQFADGMRKCLKEEFTNIYILNLKGDIRKNMLSKGNAKEGGNVFGSGSMTGIAITFFIKNPQAISHGNIFYHSIGDDLKTDEKLLKLNNIGGVNGVDKENGWEKIIPDKYSDWLNQRDTSFEKFISIGDKKDKSAIQVFESYSLGLASGRDKWCYNASKKRVFSNIKKMIEFYN